MKTFSTLDELFAAAGGHQITGQELINSRTHVFGEWQDIELSDELKNEVINQISELFGGREMSKSYIRHNLRSSRPQHWGLSRVVISKYEDSPARLEYITGQDFTYESRVIRNYLSK
jgi:hypothetical protein